MKLADVAFPGTFQELTAMGSAELRVLVGKLPGGTDLHPKIASMGYHMTKAERLDFLGWHYYGVGSADAAGKALSNGQVKYAEHQAKKGKKTGPKASPGPTNCTASAATQLANLAQALPVDTKLAADLGAWAKTLAGAPDPAELKKFTGLLSEASALPEATGPTLDNIFDLNEVVDWWDGALKAAGGDNLADAWLTAQQLSGAAKKVEGLSPELAAAAHQAAAKLANDAVLAGIDQVPNISTIVGNLSTGTAANITQALVDVAKVDLTKLPYPTGKYLADQTAGAVDIVTKATKAATNNGLDITEVLPALADNASLADDLAFKTLAFKDSLPPQYASQVDVLTGANDLATALEANAAQVAAAGAEAAAEEAITAAKATYAAMSKAELKKLGPAAFKDAGVDVPSLAHYLTKDELAEALAKLDSGQPITELLDVAQAKKTAHKAGGTAAQKAEKVPDSPVPALQANPATADTIDLPTPAIETKAAKDALPATADDVEDLSVPELGPPPDTIPLAPQSKYPKPAQTEHSWTPKAQQQALGGAHTKHQYVDEDANVWMWKKAETEGVAKGEVLAHDIGWDLGFDMADIRYADGWQVPGKGKFAHGTVQKFHQGVKGDMTQVPIGAMTPEQLAELQEHQVFDWLISQHDTHSENILVMADGHLAPIDKGQAFKFFGNDKLEVGWMPQGNFGRPVYYDLWDEYAAGRIDLDLDAIDGILARIEQTADAGYEARVRAYVRQRMDDGGRLLSFLPAKLRTEDALVDAIMGRKANIRDDFTKFYKAQAERRGVKWEPIWERRLAAAGPEKVAEVGAATVSAGITTPITQKLADDVQRFGGGGKALHLAGKDVNQGQALVYVEKASDGSQVLRMELRLEPGAEQRVTKLLRSLEDDTKGAAGTTGGGGALADPEWNTVLAYAKTVGAHASDGAYNATTVNAAKTLAGQLDAKVTAAKSAAADALKVGDIDTWATQLAQAEKLETYTKHLDDITQAMDAGAAPSYKATQFDAAQAKQRWLAEAPDAPATKTDEPAPGIFTELKVGRDRMQRTTPTDGFMQFQRTGEEPDVLVGYSSYTSGFDHADPGMGSVGRQFDGKLNVNGTTVGMHYRGYDMTAAVPRKGLIDLEVKGWDGSPEAIEQMLAAVDRMGVDVRLATAEDEALTYWRNLTGSMKQSTEYASPSTDPSYLSSPYARIRETIDAIEAKVAKAGNLTSAQEADIYREGFTDLFGADAVARAPEAITHRRNIFGEEMGMGHVRRFDLPEDISTFWSKQAGHIHGSRRITPNQFNTYDGAPSTGELVRHGTAVLDGSTTSAEADLFTGGADGTFASPGWSSWTGGNDFVIGRPAAIDARASTYAYSGDRYGSLGQRQIGNYLDPAKSIRSTIQGGESVTRGSISFGEDVEAIVVRSSAKRDAMLADLRSMGVTEIRGLPIEERVLYAQTDTEAKALIKKVTKERRESMFNPYADVPGAPRTEPGLPPAPKPKRVRKPKAAPEPDVPLATDVVPPDPFKPVTADLATSSGEAGKLATDQVSNAGWVTATPGQKVADDASAKVFNYAVPGIQGKLPVQYVDLGTQGTKIIAQHTDGNWYMVADAVGKTNKDQLIEYLFNMGWPGAKAPAF